MAGELISLKILDATPIDPKSSIGPSGSGWVAECVLAGIVSTVGTLDAKKLVLQVSDPGYLADGATTSVLRTIRGTAHVRRTMPDANERMVSTDGADLTILIALDDEIWSGTTITSAQIESGFYPGSTASSAGIITNNSTITYKKPHCGWLNFNGDICRENSVYVELAAGHIRAMRGQQVACVEFFVTDGATTSASVFANSPHLSTLQTLGNIAEVYSATLDMSGQTNGSFSTVPAKIYPHIGDSSAILDLGVDGVAWPTPVSQTPLRIFCDRTGAYGGAIAYIDGIGAGTPTVSTNAATAKANPFASQPAAHAAIIAWNNANRGHNDIGGSIVRYINDTTSPKTYDIVNSSTNAPGLGPSITERDPEALGEVIRTNIAQRQTPSNIIYRNLTFLASSGHANYRLLGYSSSGSPASQIFLDNCVIDNQTTSNFTSWHSYKYIRNVNFVSGPANFFQLSPADPAMAQMVGCISSSVTVGPISEAAYTTIGCAMTGLTVSLPPTGWPSGRDGMFVYNCRIRQVWISNTTLTTLSRGLYIAQCLVEFNIPESAVGMNVFADGDLTSIQNYVDVHNSAFGQRCSRFYNDNVNTRIVPNGLVKRGRSMFSVYDNYNIKDDRFSGGGVGSVGAWAYEYGVGNIGNVSLFGSVNRIGGAPANNADDNYLGMAWNASSTPSLHNTVDGPTQAEVMDLFENYTVAPRAAPAYGGDYRLAAYPSALTDRVPAGLGAFKYDIAGNLRKQDGTGAAGAYEYPYNDSISSESSFDLNALTFGVVASSTLNVSAATAFDISELTFGVLARTATDSSATIGFDINSLTFGILSRTAFDSAATVGFDINDLTFGVRVLAQSTPFVNPYRIPGMNLYRAATKLIATDKLDWFTFASRERNALGNWITTYSAPVEIRGSVQPVEIRSYKQLGLDMSKRYVTLFTDHNAKHVARQSAPDRFEWSGAIWEAIGGDDWFKQDGWREVVLVCIGSSEVLV